jgi:hypothetical protein
VFGQLQRYAGGIEKKDTSNDPERGLLFQRLQIDRLEKLVEVKKAGRDQENRFQQKAGIGENVNIFGRQSKSQYE